MRPEAMSSPYETARESDQIKALDDRRVRESIDGRGPHSRPASSKARHISASQLVPGCWVQATWRRCSCSRVADERQATSARGPGVPRRSVILTRHADDPSIQTVAAATSRGCGGGPRPHDVTRSSRRLRRPRRGIEAAPARPERPQHRGDRSAPRAGQRTGPASARTRGGGDDASGNGRRTER